VGVHVRAEDRRRKLIDAAIEVIASEGLARATTRRITAQAEVPLAVMHYCFAGKEELLRAVAQEVIERTYPWVGRVETGAGLEAAIRSVTTEVWEWLQREPDVQVALMEVLVWNARNRQRAGVDDRVYQPTFELLAGRLEEAAAASGEVPAVALRDVTRLLVAAVDGLFMQFLATGERAPVEPTLRLLADTAVAVAVGVPSPAGRPAAAVRR
jgi:AcrR family transcriptional regulator